MGVFGFTENAARAPSSLIRATSACGSAAASTWKMMVSAPAFA